jgi:hypothetical protein
MARRRGQSLTETKENKYDWERVKQHLETLPDIKARLGFLIEIRTEFEQEEGWWARLDTLDTPFSKKCDLEIQKLKQLLALEKNRAQRETEVGKCNPEFTTAKRNPEFTMEQTALAMHYLLRYTRAKCTNVEKARFISFLTGFSENTIRQFLSKVHTKKNDNPIAWEENMKLVKRQFEVLRQPEIIKMIDNDLNFED